MSFLQRNHWLVKSDRFAICSSQRTRSFRRVLCRHVSTRRVQPRKIETSLKARERQDGYKKLLLAQLPLYYDEERASVEAEWMQEFCRVQANAHLNHPDPGQTDGFEIDTREGASARQYLNALKHLWEFAPQIAPLLGACGSIPDARQEYKWLRKHVNERQPAGVIGLAGHTNESRLQAMCQQRFSGMPLQFLLGSEYFGEVEISCEPGVLIPRQDTANQILHLLRILEVAQERCILPTELRILDLCSGSGCISLLLGHNMPYQKLPSGDIVPQVSITGVEISEHAIGNAKENHRQFQQRIQSQTQSHMQSQTRFNPQLVKLGLKEINFLRADVLDTGDSKNQSGISSVDQVILDRPGYDIVVCNPPYISEDEFETVTNRSVRLYEPRSALVPPQAKEHGDVFYRRVLETAQRVDAKIVLMEVGSTAQALRVAKIARTNKQQSWWSRVEIWHDDLLRIDDHVKLGLDEELVHLGRGSGRSVVCIGYPEPDWVKRYGHRTNPVRSIQHKAQ